MAAPTGVPPASTAARPAHAAQGAPAPALHRVDAARDAARARRARRHRAARRAGRGVAAAAVGGRREGLVPLPAALRRRPVGAAHRGRRTPAGARGRRGRRRATAAGGWRSRSTRAATPPASAGSPPSPTWCSTPSGTPRRATGLGMAVVIAANRTRHPLDARTLARLAAQYAGRGVVGFGLSNDERRGQDRGLRAGVRDRRAGRAAAGPARRRAARARRASAPASTTCTPTGSATASASAEDPALLDRIVEAGVALEVCPVSNVALGVYTDLTLGAAAHAARRRRDGRPRRRRPAAVRLAAGRAVRHHAGRPRPRPTPSSPSSPGCRSGRRGRPTDAHARSSPRSTPGWPTAVARWSRDASR